MKVAIYQQKCAYNFCRSKSSSFFQFCLVLGRERLIGVAGGKVIEAVKEGVEKQATYFFDEEDHRMPAE
ncbi:MAG: hypothetical protein EOO10_24805 [Chitinophagaceae bacterium]|nr:MAG: hypothetical protein EOO10_24805 [Chitinophagaceae bacterium]